MDSFIQTYARENFDFDIKPNDSVMAETQKYQRVNHIYIILDDDPTGTQTVHDVNVYTHWDVKTLKELFRDNDEMAFILTNSRALPEVNAVSLAKEIGTNLLEASLEFGKTFTIVSRGDSTLRGHFPAEVDSLLEAIDAQEAIRMIVPAFFPGGRYTFGDVHYVKEGKELIPAADTPFAQDKSFGYSSSNLQDWVKEKYGPEQGKLHIKSISVEEIRKGNWLSLKLSIEQMKPGTICIVNALESNDLEQVVLATLLMQKTVFFRTAASLVPILIGQKSKELLSSKDFKVKSTNGNLIVVGSYVPKTTEQLTFLKEKSNIIELELNVDLLFKNSRAAYILQITSRLESYISKGEDVVLYTSRSLRFGKSQEENLTIGNLISDALVQIVKGLDFTHKNIIAKGGITSSDIATQALGIKKAKVLGQILPGIPVWETESKIKYIVFPGNVGDESALYQAYKKL